jgi:hypothetical protein
VIRRRRSATSSRRSFTLDHNHDAFEVLGALLCFQAAVVVADERHVVPLWPNGAPGFESRRDKPQIAKDYWIKNIHNPSITVFLPSKEKANGTACRQ